MNVEQKRHAVSHLWFVTRLGAVLGILGGVVALAAWPHTTVDSLIGAEEHGSRLLADVGLVAAWIGNTLLFVALVGWGVKLGREASPTEIHGES